MIHIVIHVDIYSCTDYYFLELQLSHMIYKSLQIVRYITTNDIRKVYMYSYT